MKKWRHKEVIVAKGARAPRPHPNHEKKEKKDERRKLLRILGRDEAQVTRSPPGRNGSRLRAGESRATRKIVKGGGSWDDEYEERGREASEEGSNGEHDSPKSSPVVDLESYRQKKTNPGSQEPEEGDQVDVEKGKPHIWTLDDFSEAKLAEYEARQAENQPDFATMRRQRREMEEMFDAAEKKRQALYRAAMGGSRRPLQTQEESEQPEEEAEEASTCVHHLDLSKVGGSTGPTLAQRATRPKMGSSHKGSSKKRKKQ